MYMDKWWGNVTCGDTDDSMVLIDYFRMKNKNEYTLGEIIKDAQIDNIWGKKPLYESSDITCRFWMDDEHTCHADIDIPINLVIDLSALLLQSFVEGSVLFEDEDREFSISAEKKDLQILITELKRAIQEPRLYYPDWVQDEFAEMKDGIIEICNELKAYC